MVILHSRASASKIRSGMISSTRFDSEVNDRLGTLWSASMDETDSNTPMRVFSRLDSSSALSSAAAASRASSRASSRATLSLASGDLSLCETSRSSGCEAAAGAYRRTLGTSERRPDITAAERMMAEANALIGVGKATYYPVISISASGGTQTSAISNLFTCPARFWSSPGRCSRPPRFEKR